MSRPGTVTRTLGRISSVARQLRTVLANCGFNAELEDEFEAARPAIDDMPTALADEMLTVYRKLGGRNVAQGDPPRFRPDSWDLRIERVLVELDEARHFNRYRAQTLAAPAYERLPAFPLVGYAEFCARYEGECLAAAGYGGYWTNASAEKMFGPAGPPKELSGAGAPRWKQRAFYDFLKDLGPACGHGPMVRLAVWDEVPGCDGLTLGEALVAKSADRRIACGVMRLVRLRSRE